MSGDIYSFWLVFLIFQRFQMKEVFKYKVLRWVLQYFQPFYPVLPHVIFFFNIIMYSVNLTATHSSFEFFFGGGGGG